MFNFIIFAIFALFSPLLGGSLPSSNQANANMRPTDETFKSSPQIRHWAFLILQRANYQNPEKVTIINNPYIPLGLSPIHMHHACARADQKIINFDENYFKASPIGVTLATIGHEVIHIKDNHDPQKITLTQQHERYADSEGLRLGGCEKCGLEIAHYYMEKHNDTTHQANSLSILPSLKEFGLASFAQQNIHMSAAQEISAKHCTTHPSNVERAYYLYRLSQSSALKGFTCNLHQLAHEKKQKRRIIIRSLLQEAQQRKKNITGAKRTRAIEDKDDKKNSQGLPFEKKRIL